MIAWTFRLLSLLPALVVLSCASCAHASTHEEDVMQVYIDMPHDGVNMVRVLDEDKAYSPLQMGRSKDGVCILLIYHAPNIEDFYREMRGDYWVALRTMVAHELGHCAHSPGVGDTDDEVAADRYALSYILKHRPQDFDKAVKFLVYLRRRYPDPLGEHATPAQIRQMAKELSQ